MNNGLQLPLAEMERWLDEVSAQMPTLHTRIADAAKSGQPVRTSNVVVRSIDDDGLVLEATYTGAGSMHEANRQLRNNFIRLLLGAANA